MPAVARQYTWGVSAPTFLIGHCPTCRKADWLDQTLPYTANDPTICNQCGRTHPRHEWIQASLVNIDPITWGLLASDFVVWDMFQMSPDDWATYDIKEPVAKRFLASPNPHGRPNSDVVRPWVNGLEITRRSRNMWIIDFPPGMSEEKAAQYEAPYE